MCCLRLREVQGDVENTRDDAGGTIKSGSQRLTCTLEVYTGHRQKLLRFKILSNLPKPGETITNWFEGANDSLIDNLKIRQKSEAEIYNVGNGSTTQSYTIKEN